ncbi:MAG: 30S ribosomal protein S13 [Candidatus Krumholzibacteria bacterium]|nr:30S ribosomal protein S13 [Candidatus Krumholzibacteria bacterium]
MARIVGVDIPDQKHIEIALTYIFGIGRSSARKILEKANVPFDVKTRDMTEGQTVKIRDIIENEFKIEGSLRSETTINIKRLMDIGAYRGLRHRHGLPARGQRTHTNARTRKGPRTRPGSKRKK